MEGLRKGAARGAFVVLGRAGMDLFADPPGTRSEEAETFRADLGGSSANIAVGLCKLGQTASLVTSVSDDAVGRFCTNRLNFYGVETQFVRSVGGEARTSLAVYESRIEEFQNVIYRNGAADFVVTPEDIDRVDLSRFGALVTAGTVFAAEPSRGATFHAFERARAAGLPIVFDIDYRPYSWPSPEVASDVLSRAGAMSDAVVGNDEEWGFMAGAHDRGLAEARALGGGGALAVYKMGERGAVTFAGGEEIRTGVFPAAPVKPNGAGDSFMAGLLAGLAEGRPLREAIERGSACAAIVVSKPGCAPAMPDTAELDAFLARHAQTAEA
jgi:5-dehydro-2-deoxygluconokinase